MTIREILFTDDQFGEIHSTLSTRYSIYYDGEKRHESFKLWVERTFPQIKIITSGVHGTGYLEAYRFSSEKDLLAFILKYGI